MDHGFDRSLLSAEAHALLEVLERFADPDGRTQVPVSVLLGNTGLTQGALLRARGELTRHGLLRTQPGFAANGRRGPNVYTLNRPALESPSGASPASEGGESGQSETTGTFALPGPAVEEVPELPRRRHARPNWFARLLRGRRSAA